MEIVFSADGKKIASRDGGNFIKIWNLPSGEKLQRLEIPATVYSMDFSSDGKKIAVGTWTTVNLRGNNEREVIEAIPLTIFDADSGQKIREFGRGDEAIAVAFSPDGKKIIAGSKFRTARIWDTESGEELKTLEGHTHVVNFVVFSPDGKKIVTTSYDKTTRIWDAESGEELQRLDMSFNSVAVSPDSKKIAASGKGAVLIWDAESGKELKKLAHVPEETPINDRVCSVAFSPDGTKIAAGYGKGIVRIWDIGSGGELRQFETGGERENVHSIVFSPDGKKVAMGGDFVLQLWDLERLPTPVVRPAIINF